MPVSLSRIEREYVLQTLADILPPLSILIDNKLFNIPEKCYSIKDGHFFIIGFLPSDISVNEIQVYFRHKMRAMFFSSYLNFSPSGVFTFSIAVKLLKDDLAGTMDSKGTLKIGICDKVYLASVIPSYPLESILVDPEIFINRCESIIKISMRAGIGQVNSLPSYRLFEYLDSFTGLCPNYQKELKTGHFFFIDHQYAIASFYQIDKSLLKLNSLFSLTIFYDKRIINVEAELTGFVPVNSNLTVLCLYLNNAQKEDKRFLYEKLYRIKFLD